MFDKIADVHRFQVQVYYEDTDHSGFVYHPNYLKFFERAREDLIGVNTLTTLWYQDGIGFVVYRISMKYREAAIFGEQLEILTRWNKQGDYRVAFFHEAWRPKKNSPAVTCKLELVCLGPGKELIPISKLEEIVSKQMKNISVT